MVERRAQGGRRSRKSATNWMSDLTSCWGGGSSRPVTDERLARTLKVIETPKVDDAAATDARMLALLRTYAGSA